MNGPDDFKLVAENIATTSLSFTTSMLQLTVQAQGKIGTFKYKNIYKLN